MLIGIDFDNTIVSHDEVFHSLAMERRLAPPGTPAVKDAVRDALRRAGREDDWTELQGFVYGPGMEKARPFPGIIEFLALCRRRGVAVRIISHRTKTPFRGPAYDLHEAARRWLAANRFFQAAGLSPGQVFFEETKPAKLARIAEQGCTHFIDDLPEFLSEPGFPAGVERLLFDPSGLHESPWPSARSWAEAENLTFGAAELFAQAGLRGMPRLEPAPGAANNRVFLARGDGSLSLLKAYFTHPADRRDRAGAESAFSRFAWQRGLRRLPRPLASSPQRRLALFEWVEGRPLAPEEADAAAVEQALAFFTELNGLRREAEAAALPDASEACFSLEEHLSLVGRRVAALEASCRAEAGLAAFVKDELTPFWTLAEQAARRRAEQADLDLAQALPQAGRCLSPSDFGFHNALRRNDGTLCFLDFEYAGWDDPAKTVCDFFEQPAVPAPSSLRQAFIAGVSKALSGEARLAERVEVLAPVYRVKWACILLNEFLPASAARRRFALGPASLSQRRGLQLERARAKLREAVAGR